MSHFIKRSLEVLKPAYYIPEKDERLHTYIQKISTQDGLKAHSLAVAQAVTLLYLPSLLVLFITY